MLREAEAADVSQSMLAPVIPQVAFCLVSDRAANLISGGGAHGEPEGARQQARPLLGKRHGALTYLAQRQWL